MNCALNTPLKVIFPRTTTDMYNMSTNQCFSSAFQKVNKLWQEVRKRFKFDNILKFTFPCHVVLRLLFFTTFLLTLSLSRAKHKTTKDSDTVHAFFRYTSIDLLKTFMAFKESFALWTQDVNQMYVRCSEDGPDCPINAVSTLNWRPVSRGETTRNIKYFSINFFFYFAMSQIIKFTNKLEFG